MIYNGNTLKQKTSNLFLGLIGFMIGGSILLFANAQEPNYSIPTRDYQPIITDWWTQDTEVWVTSVNSGSRTTVKLIKSERRVDSRPNQQVESKNESWLQSIIHKWYSETDYRQDIVNYAYKLGWRDLVTLMECESGMNPEANWDGGKARWLCQMNTNYHKLPQEYYTSRQTQVELCAEKRKWGTKFYWPQRIIKWMKCSEYVKDRFLIK